jgi:hypothetical protein
LGQYPPKLINHGLLIRGWHYIQTFLSIISHIPSLLKLQPVHASLVRGRVVRRSKDPAYVKGVKWMQRFLQEILQDLQLLSLISLFILKWIQAGWLGYYIFLGKSGAYRHNSMCDICIYIYMCVYDGLSSSWALTKYLERSLGSFNESWVCAHPTLACLETTNTFLRIHCLCPYESFYRLNSLVSR